MPELIATTLIKDANLVAYWKLEDVNDSKGSRNFTNTGSVAFNTGKFNNGADYGQNNTTKYLSRTLDNFGLAGNADVSVSLWVKIRTEPTTLTAFFELPSTLTVSRYLLLDYDFNAGTPRLHVDASLGTTIDYNVTLGTSVYHHIVVTRNVSGNIITLYLDSVAVGTGTIGTTSTGANEFTLGSNHAGGQLSSAIFDDVAIFSRVLTAAEVALIYKDAAQGFIT